jgi:hypothetical protein
VTNQRYTAAIGSVTVGTTVAASAAIDFSNSDRGMIFVPAGATFVTLTWHASTSMNGTYLPARSESNVAVTTTVVAGQAYPIPDVLRNSSFLKITGDVAGVVGITMKD